jgi:hypothetical protein
MNSGRDTVDKAADGPELIHRLDGARENEACN